MVASFLLVFGVLLFFHFLADFPLQGEFLAKAKNHRDPIPHIPWWYALTAHSFIHAGFVFLATGSVVCFLGELISHIVIDHTKCEGEITFERDQFLHIILKLVWATWAVLV